MPHIEDLLLWAVAQEGKPYLMGAEADAADPDPPEFDCSELVQWAAARAGGNIADGAFWQYETCRKAGLLIPVDEAIATRGALLFRALKPHPTRFDDVPHVALSAAGDPPMTVEARGRAWGVGSWGAPGRFQAAGLIPGFDYGPRDLLEPGPPPVAVHTGLDLGEWHYRWNPDAGPADGTFRYGDPGDLPVAGDWDGDGIAGPGVVRGTAWLLRNTLTDGVADLSFTYGELGDIPLVGDWTGTGRPGCGVRRGNRFLLRDTLTAGVADHEIEFGNPGDTPLVGRWQAAGRADGLAVRRGDMIYLYDPASGAAGQVVSYGDPADRIVMGDWNGDGVDTPAAFRAGRWLVRNTLTDGVADYEFGFGNPDDLPLAGRWIPAVDGVMVAR